jgi:hypothetical protein
MPAYNNGYKSRLNLLITMDSLRIRAQKNSLNISLIYVGFGTLLLFVPGSNNELIATIHSGLVLLTIPVAIVGWIITYTKADRPILIMLGIQLLSFLAFWFIAFRYLLKKYEREAKLTKREQGK